MFKVEYAYQSYYVEDAIIFIEDKVYSDNWDRNETEVTEMLTEEIDALKYLADTDWYIIRYVDIGEEVPEDIVYLREEARSLL